MRCLEWMRPVIVAAGALSVGACSSTFDVNLQREVFYWDFGGASGTLPETTCLSDGDAICDQLPWVTVNTSDVTGSARTATISVGCDTSTGRCYAQADARVAEPVDVELDPGFKGTIEGKLVTFVRTIDLTYQVPSNTLTFDVPHVDVFVGPAGVLRETDAGVVEVGTTPPLAAGATLGAGQLSISDDSPAHAIIEDAVRGRQEFVFVLVFAPRILSGNAVPAGAIEVDLTPKLTIGL